MPTMTGLLSLLATGVLVALGVWLLGGVVLRVGGVLLVAGGLLSTAATGSPSAALLTVLGGLAWLGGQWHYGARHHCFSSSLARRVFHEALPRQLDPTRRWGVPNVPPEPAVGAVVALRGEQAAPGPLWRIVPKRR
jgi:hypothetical protein